MHVLETMHMHDTLCTKFFNYHTLNNVALHQLHHIYYFRGCRSRFEGGFNGTSRSVDCYSRSVGCCSLYVGCYIFYVRCYSLNVWCTGAMWDVTTFMWAVTGAMWAVTASMYDIQALCGLLQPLCMMYRHYVGSYILYACCYRRRVSRYSHYV